jgi:hypothetical protein
MKRVQIYSRFSFSSNCIRNQYSSICSHTGYFSVLFLFRTDWHLAHKRNTNVLSLRFELGSSYFIENDPIANKTTIRPSMTLQISSCIVPKGQEGRISLSLSHAYSPSINVLLTSDVLFRTIVTGSSRKIGERKVVDASRTIKHPNIFIPKPARIRSHILTSPLEKIIAFDDVA